MNTNQGKHLAATAQMMDAVIAAILVIYDGTRPGAGTSANELRDMKATLGVMIDGLSTALGWVEDALMVDALKTTLRRVEEALTEPATEPAAETPATELAAETPTMEAEVKSPSPPMMACGHAANGFAAGETPACVICDCKVVAADTSDLEGRLAQCTERGGSSHSAPVPSSTKLAFFAHHPDREFDSYYCGCRGWN